MRTCPERESERANGQNQFIMKSDFSATIGEIMSLNIFAINIAMNTLASSGQGTYWEFIALVIPRDY